MPAEMSPQPIRVMLVDDHKAVLWGLERLIESAAPRMSVVGKVGHRDELFAALRTTLADVVLLDLDLGGVSSLDFLPELRQATGARVLVLTGLRDPEAHRRALLAGARGIVLKDVPADVVLRAIEHVYAGEVWLDRGGVSRLLDSLSAPAAADTDPRAARMAALTSRERRIVDEVRNDPGAPNKVIADRLCMSEHTLRNHLTRVYEKLALRNRVELAMFALEAPATGDSPMADAS